MKTVKAVIIVFVLLAVIGYAPPLAACALIGYIGYKVGVKIKSTKDYYEKQKSDYVSFKEWQANQK